MTHRNLDLHALEGEQARHLLRPGHVGMDRDSVPALVADRAHDLPAAA